MTEATTTTPTASEAEPAAPLVSGAADRAKALFARAARMKPAERPAPVAAPVAAPAPVAKGKRSDPNAQLLEELRHELQEVSTLRATMEREREGASLAKRVEYARRSGLRGGISDDVARTLMSSFDLGDSKGQKAFEDFRRSNPAMFEEAYSADKARKATETRLGDSAKNGIFGADFVKNNLHRNLR